MRLVMLFTGKERYFVFIAVCSLLKMNSSVVFTTRKLPHLGWRFVESLLVSTHRPIDIAFVQRSSVQECIDKHHETAIRSAACHWRSILQRGLDLILYCTERGLPLHCHDEKFGSATNGNFMELLELTAKCDLFSVSHIAKEDNPGSGRSSYLSWRTFEKHSIWWLRQYWRKLFGKLKSQFDAQYLQILHQMSFESLSFNIKLTQASVFQISHSQNSKVLIPSHSGSSSKLFHTRGDQDCRGPFREEISCPNTTTFS